MVPPLGTHMTKEKSRNHQAWKSFRTSNACDQLNFFVCVVCWNFLGRREATSRSRLFKKRAVEGESGRKNHNTIDQTMVMSPKVTNRICYKDGQWSNIMHDF